MEINELLWNILRDTYRIAIFRMNFRTVDSKWDQLAIQMPSFNSLERTCHLMGPLGHQIYALIGLISIDYQTSQIEPFLWCNGVGLLFLNWLEDWCLERNLLKRSLCVRSFILRFLLGIFHHVENIIIHDDKDDRGLLLTNLRINYQ